MWNAKEITYLLHSYSQVLRERKPGLGSYFSWSSDGHTSIRICVQSPAFMFKKKKKSQMRHCASVTPVVKGAGWNRRISRQAGQPSQPVSEL